MCAIAVIYPITVENSMAKKAAPAKFGKKYGFFLTDASNEEIVSVSKELTDSFSEQVSIVTRTATALLGVSVLAVILSILMISGLSDTKGSYRNAMFILRVVGVAFLFLGGFNAFAAMNKAFYASSVSTLIWRHIRETATDDSVFEQTAAVRELSQSTLSAKNLASMSALALAVAGMVIGLSYVIEMLAESGYI